MSLNVDNMSQTTHQRDLPCDNKSVQYFHALTALRGIAALWVVFFHMDVIIFYRDLGTLLPRQWSGLLTKGYLWVDFFFILSGFIISHIYGLRFSHKFTSSIVFSYLRARFLRIYPLHLFTLLLLMVFVAVVVTFIPQAVDGSWRSYFEPQALLGNILLLNAMGQHNNLSWNIVAWSIGAEWWAYLWAIGLFYWAIKRSVKRAFVVATIAGFSLVLLVYFVDKQSLDVTFDFGVIRCLAGFTIGAALYRFYRHSSAIRLLQRDDIFALICLVIVVLLHFKLNDLLLVPLFALLILAAAYNQGRVSAIMCGTALQFLGKISYSIYLMHGVWFMVFWFLLPVVAQQWQIIELSNQQVIIYAVTFLSLTISSATLSYHYVEMPGRRLFKSKDQLPTFVPTKEI